MRNTALTADGGCGLQSRAKEYKADDLPYKRKEAKLLIDSSLPSIVRDAGKCVLCRRCVESCGSVQGLHVWNVIKRGAETAVGTLMDKPLDETECVECGQCIRNCPTGALYEHQELDALLNAVQDKSIRVVVRAEPHFLRHYLELSGAGESGYTADNLSAGLYRLRVWQVIGNGYAEAAHLQALRSEILSGAEVPVIGASCPAAVSFAEKLYPELISNLSKTASPQQLFGEAYLGGLDGKRVYTVSLTPCSAKKAEAARADKNGAVSQVISHSELHRLFSRAGVELGKLPARPLDIRVRWHNEFGAPKFSEEPIEKELVIDGRKFKAAAAYGLKAVNTLLELIADGEHGYQYVQILACPKGCISTGALLV